ncbi:MAG: hypothetical protein AUJ51_03830 [Elusimicrobia bacterium CG1_02_56_21]|nr:MAG: hypothetical protein AUJ51_03830 [Elusimicrobia bacterium CG1_02_56_21]
MRHAEKPEHGSELSPQGFKRARALVKFFKTSAAVTLYGTPAAIYAAAPKNEGSSVRSIQTVQPLAEALNLRVDAAYTRGQTHKLVRALMEAPEYKGKMVLICWQHEALVKIALELTAYNGSAATVQDSIPQFWPGETFDRAWILDFAGGKATSFTNIPQRLLPGDSSK